MPTQRAPRRVTIEDRGNQKTIDVLLQRTVIVEGARTASLIASLDLHGTSARPIQPGVLPTMVAGLVVFDQTLIDEVLPVLVKLRQQQATIASLALLDPAGESIAEVVEQAADCVLPVESDPALIAAQLRALARLIALYPPSDEPEQITVRNITIDLERHEVRVGGRVVPLTPTEFRILAQLARRPGRVVTHAEIFREIHGYGISDHEAKDILKVHIWRLRSKLAEVITDASPIINVRGVGYLLERRAGRERRGPGARD
jgi:DNA-binding response OmpR family regulator